jgi:predicted negative regulator of RcsB-dependent stress response
MSNSNHPESSPTSGEEINITPGFEEKLTLFWEHNRRGLLALCLVVLVIIVARGGWDYMAAQTEQEIQKDFAAASTPENLKSFVAANPGHVLSGVAWLTMADDAYAVGKSVDAVAAYKESLKVFETGPLNDRAALGLAMAQLQAGQNTDGEAGLKQLADTEAAGRGVRVEAAYQLASIASSAGKIEAIKNLADQIMQIDPSSPWAQRAMSLQMKTPASADASAPSPAASVEADPVIKLNLGEN